MDNLSRTEANVQIDDPFKKIQAMDRPIIESRSRLRFSRDKKERIENTKKHFDLLEARFKIVADFFGGKVTRLSEIPQELMVDSKEEPYLKTDSDSGDYQENSEEIKPFLRMDVKGRTYLLRLDNTGAVNVYMDGMYKGGNHDLTITEILDHLNKDGWFGVNP